MRIAVDVMGGDRGPRVVVEGALEAASTGDLEVALIGDGKIVNPLTDGHHAGGVSVVDAPESIGMAEHPVKAVRTKKLSSVVRLAEMVRSGEADAAVSAGNTGAVMAASLLYLGRLPGIERPAICVVLPTEKGACVLLDVGANVDCRARHLVDFGIMGSVYCEEVLGVRDPLVGLLSIGEEPCKGNEVALQAYELMSEGPFRFAGNVEGRDIPTGAVDVVVCDGFVGNILLKFAEGLSGVVIHMLEREIHASALRRCAAMLLRPGLVSVKKKLDCGEYGGAPLLGLRGVVMIAHGNSDVKAIKNAVLAAGRAASSRLIEKIDSRTANRQKRSTIPE